MAANTSLDILAHFDQNATTAAQATLPTRGILWVLQWSAALAVLVVSATILIEFAYCLAAETTLHRAAQAGALEATLPRATRATITQAVERRLAMYDITSGRLRLSVEQNNTPVLGALQAKDGDCFSVAVSIRSTAVLPHWLKAASFWRSESQMTARAERRVPGRNLKISGRD